MSSLLSLLSLKSIGEEETKSEEEHAYFSCVLALVFCFVSRFIFLYPVRFVEWLAGSWLLLKTTYYHYCYYYYYYLRYYIITCVFVSLSCRELLNQIVRYL
jgi:hypothetical protein